MAKSATEIQRSFFSASSFAVAGASGNPDKFGYKLVAWYKSRNLPVTPITPSCASILDIAAVNSIADLSTDLAHTSLSIVTPPKVSLQILKDAAEQKSLLGIWLQPGAEDGSVKDFVTNDAWLKERTVYGGSCVLVLGDRLRSEAQKL